MGVDVVSAVCAIDAAAAYPMYGVRAVTTPTFVSTWAASFASFASMPVTQCTRRVSQPFAIHCSDCMIECAMIGSNALSCSWPPSAAIVTVVSAPTTANAIWFTTSGITGFTLRA